MDVSELLTLMSTLSIGLDEPTDTDIPVFLRFLNLAYFEILQETLAQNPNVSLTTEILDCVDGVVTSMAETPFNIKCVWDNTLNSTLEATTLDELQKVDPAISQKGQPQKWYLSGGKLHVYPLYTGKIGVRYIPEPKSLEYKTLSEDILIPKTYQMVLADGGAYYMFQSESGFKDANKMDKALIKWLDGKQKLFLYLKNLGGKQYYSSYSRI